MVNIHTQQNGISELQWWTKTAAKKGINESRGKEGKKISQEKWTMIKIKTLVAQKNNG